MQDRPADGRARRRGWGLTPPRIVLIYVLLGFCYIGMSDRAVLLLVPDRYISSWVDTIKGWMFIALTGVLLYVLIRRGSQETRRDQAARLASEERLRTILETQPECVKVVTAEGVLRQMNRAGLAMIEADSLEQVVGQSVLPVIAPESRDAYAGMLRRVGAGVREENEFEIVGLKGTRRRLQSSNVPLYAPDGTVEGVLALTRDITQRRKAEAALRESEARYRAVVEDQTELICRFKPGGGLVFVNQAYARYFGRSVESLVGTNLFDLILDEAERERLRQVTATIRRDMPVISLEARWRMADGEVRVRHWVDRGLFDERGELVEVQAVGRDITERVRADEALRLSEATTRALLEAVPDLLFRMDRRGRYLAYHAQRAEDLMVPPEEFLGKTAMEVLPRARAQQCMENLEAVLRTGEARTYEYDTEREGGKLCWEVRVVRCGPDEALLLVRNIWERKEAQRRQEMMMAELDHRVKNNLAAVLALAEQSVRAAASLEAFSPAFLGRVRAMARMHTALAHGRWEGAPLRQLIRQSLEAYMMRPDGAPLHSDGPSPDRIGAEGPEVVIPARAVSPLAMALHELATNAAKYGALSAAGGRVRVQWSVERNDRDRRELSLCWSETGGPAVREPARTGFGTELIRGAVAHELRGEVSLEFAEGGVCCRIRLPLEEDGAGAMPEVAAPAG